MRIPLERDSAIPLYAQIEEHLRRAIQIGGLPPGTRLPATRALARDLGINRLTVESAYAALESDGLVVARVGSGTYVAGPLPAVLPPSPQTGWPAWQQGRLNDSSPTGPSPSDLLLAGGYPDPIDLSSGTGDPALVPAEAFRKMLNAVLRQDGAAAQGYGERAGYLRLRESIARVLASQGLITSPGNILITSGSQQAIALVCQTLLQRGDTILVESPTYAAGLDLFRACGLQVIGIPLDGDGLQVEALAGLIEQHKPGLLYTIPNFHNPTGTCLSGRRRRQLLALAGRYNLPILEDDFVGDLRYEGRAQPALKALDPGGQVLYVSTFSKMLMPGLRVGFLVAEGPVFSRLVECKRVTDLATANPLQRALEAYVTVGRYQMHLRRSCLTYRRRRDALVAAVRQYLPEGVALDVPMGGLFLWLRLPAGIRAADLLARAAAAGVAFAPGPQFFPHPPDGEGYLRLNFASQPPAIGEEAIRRLAKVVERALKGTTREL
ncbi:MAG: PLP-dependent aminotransferase family protein [Anaerolineales bacterium]|nr:PLP-dependent aminotransferase family protein [Anaerolineales bacterium]